MPDWKPVNLSLGAGARRALDRLAETWGVPRSQVVARLLEAAADALDDGYTLDAGPPPASCWRPVTWVSPTTARGALRPGAPLCGVVEEWEERTRGTPAVLVYRRWDGHTSVTVYTGSGARRMQPGAGEVMVDLRDPAQVAGMMAAQVGGAA